MSYAFSPTESKHKIDYKLLSSYWFAYHFFWTAVIALILQSRLVDILQHQGMIEIKIDQIKDQQLGLLFAAGALFSTIVQLTIGYFSDFTVSRFGRRKPYIFWGVLMAVGAIWWMFSAGSLVSLYCSYFAIQLTVNFASVPYQALLPDLVDPAEHGKASAAMGLADFSGKLMGLILMLVIGVFNISEISVPLSYTLLFIGGMITVLNGIKTEPSEPVITEEGTRVLPLALPLTRIEVPKSWRGPFLSVFASVVDLLTKPSLRTLLIVSISRTIIHSGYYAFIPFFKYYLETILDPNSVPEFTTTSYEYAIDVVGPKVNGTIVGAMVFIMIIIGGLIGTLLIGRRSDTVDKRNLVWFSSGLAAGFLLLMLITSNFYLILLAGLGLGVGWGGFVTTDWAWACNLMPRGRTGAFMGVWDMTTLLPQVFAASLAGTIIAALKDMLSNNSHVLAYKVCFLGSFFCILLGALVLLFIRIPNNWRAKE